MGTPLLHLGRRTPCFASERDLPDNDNMTQNGVTMKSPLGEVFKVPEDNRKELESLNKSLNDYISMVQNLDSSWQGGIISRRTTVNVNVDRKTISVNLSIKEELDDIQKKCKKNDGEIAELLGKIWALECQMRQNSKKPDVEGYELTNKHLEDEVCRLKCSLKFLEDEKRTFEEQKKELEKQIEDLKKLLENKVEKLNNKRKENADIKADVKIKEKELRFQVSLKSREVTAERTKTNINMEEIKEKQVESHKIWMKKQLDELREMYEKQKVDVAATMRDMYIQKEAKLTAEVEKAKVVNKVDTKIKEELERLRLQLGELQTNNQQLGVRKTEIAAELDLKSNAYAEQLSAKEKELLKLRGDHAKIRAEIEEMMGGLNHEQVALYNQALTPEMRRITDKARGRWGKEQMVNMSKVVNYSHKFSSTSVTNSVKASSSRKSEASRSGSRKAVLDESGIGLGVEDVVQEVLAKKSPSDKNKK